MIQRIGGRPRPPQTPPATSNRLPGAGGTPFTVNPPQSQPNQTASTGPALRAVQRVVADLEQQRQEIDRVIRQAAGGQSFSPAQLLLLQSKVYSYSQQMEVVSRMVDKTVSAVKTTLNTQL